MRLSFVLLPCLAALPISAAAGESSKAPSNSFAIVSSRIAEHEDAIGAGVVVSLRPHGLRVITARHVADRGAVTVWIGRRPYPAEVVRTFADRDVAVVDAIVPDDVCRHATAATAGSAAGPGDAILIWGETAGSADIKAGSVVAAGWAPPGAVTAPLLRIECASCRRGDSGGGIFDMEGRLLGILVARYARPDGTTLATVGERIDEELYAGSDDVAAASRP